jgi:hypothetical protein
LRRAAIAPAGDQAARQVDEAGGLSDRPQHGE